MPTLAAIDTGSNAVRMVVATHDGLATPLPLETHREPIRLGADVFSTGRVSQVTVDRLVAAFQRFSLVAGAHSVTALRAVGTSALRDARNADDVIREVALGSGIQLEVISGSEEARLVSLAVAGALDLAARRALLVDIGGGSVELSILSHGVLVRSESLPLGAIRLLRAAAQSDTRALRRQLADELDAAQRRIESELAQGIDIAAGTGGPIDTLAELNARLLGDGDRSMLRRDELRHLLELLEPLSTGERVERFALKPDKADVIIPAALLLEQLMTLTGVETLAVPHVGLKDGVLLDLAQGPSKAREGGTRAGLPVEDPSTGG